MAGASGREGCSSISHEQAKPNRACCFPICRFPIFPKDPHVRFFRDHNSCRCGVKWPWDVSRYIDIVFIFASSSFLVLSDYWVQTSGSRIPLKPVLGVTYNFPVPLMKRLNQTEPALCSLYFRRPSFQIILKIGRTRRLVSRLIWDFFCPSSKLQNRDM